MIAADLAAGSSPLLSMAGSIAYTHHERWDGGGYPCGLKQEEIPIEGRIAALADVFDALTSQRSYKPAFDVEDSLEIVRQERGKHFDPAVVDAFFAGVKEIRSVYHEFRDLSDEAVAH
jgi:putative two-component system response regulator